MLPSIETAQPAPAAARWDGRLTKLIFWFISASWQATTDSAHAIISRLTGHLVVLALAAGAVVLSGVTLAAPSSLSQMTRPASPDASRAAQKIAAPLDLRADLALSGRVGQPWRTQEEGSLVRAALPLTEIPSRLRRAVITYTVEPGDTVQGIAILFSIKPETIMWSNSAIEDAPDYLRIGQQVVIIPIDGVYHTVAKGDTLESIAKKYKVGTEAITGVSFNSLQLPDYRIEPGMKLIVAGGEKPYVPKVVTSYAGPVPEGARGTGRFQWPTLGTLTQVYWWGHRALDIATATGTPVYAADGGFVSFAGWTDVGYGRLIVIDHANGYATYYAHLNSFNVIAGQSVQRGQLIGTVGSTGNSSGPHVHFEIRYNHSLLNPRLYLP